MIVLLGLRVAAVKREILRFAQDDNRGVIVKLLRRRMAETPYVRSQC
jgi:hypothetical protein